MSAEDAIVIALSLKVALVATIFCLPIAVGLALLLARRDFFGKSLVNALVHLPLLLPPVVTGYALLLTFGRKGFIGEALYNVTGFTFAFRWWGAALAAALHAYDGLPSKAGHQHERHLRLEQSKALARHESPAPDPRS